MSQRVSSFLVHLSVFFVSMLLIQQCNAASYDRYTTHNSEGQVKREILSLLKRMVVAAHLRSHPAQQQYLKRNGGTSDDLYNLPDLLDIGKRR